MDDSSPAHVLALMSLSALDFQTSCRPERERIKKLDCIVALASRLYALTWWQRVMMMYEPNFPYPSILRVANKKQNIEHCSASWLELVFADTGRARAKLKEILVGKAL